MATSDDGPELLARCMEELAATVLDAGEPMTYRTLGASAHVSADVSRDAMHAFAKDNASSVSALEVVVQRGATTKTAASGKAETKVDPRARVIRIGSFSPASDDGKVLSRQIYSVYKKRAGDDSTGESDVEPIAIACWSQERSLRNDIFQKVERQAPLSRAARAFYASGIKCPEATARTGFGDTQGEESVSVFDSVTAAKKPVVSTSSKTFFKASSSSSSGSGGSAATKSRTSSSTASGASKATPAKQQPETKKIDAKSMSNVFTIDSDDDEDEDEDGDAPVFVKKASSGAVTKPRSKRVISDDEDEDDEDAFETSRSSTKSAATPARAVRSTKSSVTGSSSSSSRNVKRKLSASPDEKVRDESDKHAKAVDADADDQVASKKKSARQQQQDEEEEEEEPAATAAVPTTRRVEVTKTRINEQGYMVTEKTYEEVELTAEDIEQERLAAAKKKKAAAAARAAAEAKAAAAEKKAKSSSGPSGPAKQKNLFAFFNRK